MMRAFDCVCERINIVCCARVYAFTLRKPRGNTIQNVELWQKFYFQWKYNQKISFWPCLCSLYVCALVPDTEEIDSHRCTHTCLVSLTQLITRNHNKRIASWMGWMYHRPTSTHTRRAEWMPRRSAVHVKCTLYNNNSSRLGFRTQCK